MPRIELIDVPLFNPSDPYHWQYDNLPLKSLIFRQEAINSLVDNLRELMDDAVGTQGTVSNRLNQSINPDGSIKKTSIDDLKHSIEEHADTTDYVRMTKTEREKLVNVSDDATDVTIEVADSTGEHLLDSGRVKFVESTTIRPRLQNPNVVRFDMRFPVEFAHKHYYGVVPVPQSASNDFKNYKVNSLSTAFIEGSLRVYINGVRISSGESIYVPGNLVDDPWTLLKFTPSAANGTFILSAPIAEEDLIEIDFDIPLVAPPPIG